MVWRTLNAQLEEEGECVGNSTSFPCPLSLFLVGVVNREPTWALRYLVALHYGSEVKVEHAMGFLAKFLETTAVWCMWPILACERPPGVPEG